MIELTVIIVVVGVLIAVAMQSMTAVVQDARITGTDREMEMLARAIVGNPDLTSNGKRSDFGYVGDIGAFRKSMKVYSALVDADGDRCIERYWQATS